MEHWFIVGIVILLIVLYFLRTRSFFDSPGPAPAPGPGPQPIPSSNWTQTMIIPVGGTCEPGWTKIGQVTCAK